MSHDASDWVNAANATQVLLRSHIEIVKLLQAACDAGVPVIGRPKDSLFISRLHGLSQDGKYVLVDFSDNKATNSEILATDKLTLWFNLKNSHIEFLARHALEHFHAGAAICFDTPDTLIVQQRRSYQRITLIPSVPLNCLADGAGIMPFDAKIIDIGMGGAGAMIYSDSIMLTPGMLLSGCRITLPDLSQVIVDMRICDLGDIVMFEGRPAFRAGCSFVGDHEVIEKLVRVFMLELERREERGPFE